MEASDHDKLEKFKELIKNKTKISYKLSRSKNNKGIFLYFLNFCNSFSLRKYFPTKISQSHQQ